MSVRVAGADPGTSSLDLLLLEDGRVRDQCRFLPDDLRADAGLPLRWLEERGPFDLIAGPSGYGMPLRRAADCSDRDLALLTLMRTDDPVGGKGLVGLSTVLRFLRSSSLPVVFLPGVIHLPTVPDRRKYNRIDLGTPDKLAVGALAAAQYAADWDRCACCVVEMGSAFTACLVLDRGQVVDGVGGTSGPLGWRGSGAWDGEVAYLLAPLAKRDLFAGGVESWPRRGEARLRYREDLRRAVAGLQAVTPFAEVWLSGALFIAEPALAEDVTADLSLLGRVRRLPSLPDAWVKQAAQGAALVADGLAGGTYRPLVERLAIEKAQGSTLDWLPGPRGAAVRATWS